MPASTTLSPAALKKLLLPLARSKEAPCANLKRQPAHTVYGGAHLFRRGTAARVGEIALASLETHAPSERAFAEVFGTSPEVYARVREKLAREAVEDYRVDFEDGFGSRSDAEEDAAALEAASETAIALGHGGLPPFFGIRIKSLARETRVRALRTLDLYLTALLSAERRLPENFVITLPKVTAPAEVKVLIAALRAIERKFKRPPTEIEIMVETPRSLFTAGGALALPGLAAAAGGRLRGAHFGAYDYTASLGIAATAQSLGHPACDFARQLMQLSLAESPAWLSDGATGVMPVGKDSAAVHAAWRAAYGDVRRSLSQGFYQGWDLHPAQLPARYAAIYSFFSENLAPACARLRNFLDKAAQATLVGTSFDDAATGQGLLNFFLRGHSCGALRENEVEMAGITVDELGTRSFARILEGRSR